MVLMYTPITQLLRPFALLVDVEITPARALCMRAARTLLWKVSQTIDIGSEPIVNSLVMVTVIRQTSP